MSEARFYAPSGGGEIIVPRTAFASPQGSDITGLAERMDKPFKTIAAAQSSLAALIPTSTNRCMVVALPNLWTNEDIICQQNVDFELYGTFLKTLGDGAIITDNNVGVDSTVFAANANFIVQSPANTGMIIYSSHPASNITLYANNLTVVSTLATMACFSDGGRMNIFCNNIITANQTALYADLTGSVQFVRCNKIENIGGAGGCILGTGLGANQTVYANEVVSLGASMDNLILCDQQAIQNLFISRIQVTANNRIAVVNKKGGFQTVYNSFIVGTGNGSVFGTIEGASEAGGQQRLINCRIEHLGNGPAVYIKEVNTILDNCTLVASGSRSIDKVNPPAVIVRLYGTCQANKAQGGQITVSVGTLIVNATVV